MTIKLNLKILVPENYIESLNSISKIPVSLLNEVVTLLINESGISDKYLLKALGGSWIIILSPFLW
ncbi:TPA: hypothetical protein I9148_002907 [Clostridium perfringens]|nr:hypothetical protein [Clostridium perfringens]